MNFLKMMECQKHFDNKLEEIDSEESIDLSEMDKQNNLAARRKNIHGRKMSGKITIIGMDLAKIREDKEKLKQNTQLTKSKTKASFYQEENIAETNILTKSKTRRHIFDEDDGYSSGASDGKDQKQLFDEPFSKLRNWAKESRIKYYWFRAYKLAFGGSILIHMLMN